MPGVRDLGRRLVRFGVGERDRRWSSRHETAVVHLSRVPLPLLWPRLWRLVVIRRVHHKQPPRNPNLRRRQPNTTRILHRHKHIRHQPLQLLVEITNRLPNLQQNSLRIMNYRQDRHKLYFTNPRAERRISNPVFRLTREIFRSTIACTNKTLGE